MADIALQSAVLGEFRRKRVIALAMPALVLSFPCLASVARVARAEMIETLSSDYVLGAVKALVAPELAGAGLNVFVASNLPVGAGLSSSAAVEIAMSAKSSG